MREFSQSNQVNDIKQQLLEEVLKDVPKDEQSASSSQQRNSRKEPLCPNPNPKAVAACMAVVSTAACLPPSAFLAGGMVGAGCCQAPCLEGGTYAVVNVLPYLIGPASVISGAAACHITPKETPPSTAVSLGLFAGAGVACLPVAGVLGGFMLYSGAGCNGIESENKQDENSNRGVPQPPAEMKR